MCDDCTDAEGERADEAEKRLADLFDELGALCRGWDKSAGSAHTIDGHYGIAEGLHIAISELRRTIGRHDR